MVNASAKGRFPLTSIDNIAAKIAKLPARSVVGVDGVDGSGKTTFADKLKPAIEKFGRHVLRASVDGFHNPRNIRYARGRHDPLGYFLDSFNYYLLEHRLIRPFREGRGSVETKAFDYITDSLVSETEEVPYYSILVIDGIFLHRDEVIELIDLGIFLSVSFDVAFKRLAQRDGFDPDPKAESNYRYYNGQLIYFEICNPIQRATLVLDNSD